jgi:glycosyltransferase involved in cell wall biosynthesis
VRDCERLLNRASTGQIAIFVPFIYAFGGVERLAIDLSRYLHGRGLDHAIVCFRQAIDLSSHATWPVEVHELRPTRNFISEGWAMSRYFRRVDTAEGPVPLFFDLKSAFYAGLFGCPRYCLQLSDTPSLFPADVSKFALSLRKMYPRNTSAEPPGVLRKIRGELVHQVNRRGVARSRTLITMTTANSKEFAALYGKEAKVIRQGAALPSVKHRLAGRKLKPFRLLSVSRLEQNKRLDWVFEALAKLETSDAPLSAQCDWVLDVVGDGSQAAPLRDLARRLNIESRVTFHGRASDAALETLYADAALFLMPAIQGYGLPALEALSREVPVILHRESGVSEILGNSPWVTVIDRGSDDLALAIQTMVGNILSGAVEKHPIPRFPTDMEWAEEIAKACGWVRG